MFKNTEKIDQFIQVTQILLPSGMFILALATFVLSIMTLRLYQKEINILINAAFLNCYFPNPEKNAFCINANNIGKRTATIAQVEWAYRNFPFSRQRSCVDTYLFKNEFPQSTKLPAILNDGDTLTLIYPSDIFKTYIINNQPFMSKNKILNLFRSCTLSFYLKTSVGKKIKVKISCKMRYQIFKSLYN